jgi:hypothetical protein
MSLAKDSTWNYEISALSVSLHEKALKKPVGLLLIT